MTEAKEQDAVVARTLAAERAVLGAVLIDPSRLEDAADALGGPDAWFRLAHRVLWSGIERLRKKGAAVDPLTVLGELAAKDAEEVGGAAYVYSLTDGVPRSANVEAYAAQVRDFATRRQLAQDLRPILLGAQNGECGAAELIDRAQGAIGRLRGVYGGNRAHSPEQRADALLTRMLDGKPRQPGILTGLRQLDSILLGMRPGQMLIIGARTSTGKTVLGLQVTVAAGKVGPALFVSLEMTAEEICTRELALRSRVPFERIDSNRLGEHELDAVAQAQGDMRAGNVYVFDRAGATVPNIRAEARRIAAEAGRPLSVIVVDYLQLMGTEPGVRVENRVQQVSEFSRGLKSIAMDLGVPVVALAQLNRLSEQRDDKRPQLSDLRESGALEQDAHVVMLLYRPNPGKHDDHQVILDVAKNRNGPKGLVSLTLDGPTMTFRETTRAVAQMETRK